MIAKKHQAPFRTPDEIRRGDLSDDSILDVIKECRATNVMALLGFPTGVGKTERVASVAAKGRWKPFCSFVVVLLPSWQAVDEFKAKLRKANPTLIIATYERRDPKLCGSNDRAMRRCEEDHLGELAKAHICSACPNAKTCAHFQSDTSMVGLNAEVILACDQRLNYNPQFIFNLWQKRKAMHPGQNNLPPLVVIDECLSADRGFVTEVRYADITNEIAAVQASASIKATDRQRILDHLHAVLADDRSAAISTEIISRAIVEILEAGVRRFGRGYRPVLRAVATYKYHRIWSTSDRCAMRFNPWLPATTIFCGAYLRPIYLARRYGLLMEPVLYGKGVKIRDPGTIIVNMLTALYNKKYRQGNLPTIIAFLADLIASRIAKGKTTLIVGRKGAVAMHAKERLEQALLERGHQVVVHLEPTGMPVDAKGSLLPLPTDIGYIHYGLPGLNLFENYQAAVVIHGPIIPDQDIAKAVYTDIPPQDRVPLHVINQNGYRRIQFQDAVEPQLQRYADAVLFRLEADAALQAFSRVRFGTNPRLVIMCMAYELDDAIGPVPTLRVLGCLRPFVGLGSAHQGKVSRQLNQIPILAAQGLNRAAIARKLGLCPRTITSRLTAAGIALRQGRPPTRNRANPHPIL